MATPTPLNIGIIAKKYGLSLKALRHYEQKGLLQPIRIGKHRFYEPEQENRLRLVLRGLALNFSVDEIGTLLAAGSTTMISPKLHPRDIPKVIEGIEQRRAVLGELLDDLRQAYDQAIADNVPMEKTRKSRAPVHQIDGRLLNTLYDRIRETRRRSGSS